MKKYLMLMLMITTLIFTGCTNSKDNSNVNGNAGGEVKLSGGEIKIATTQYETINPLLNKNADADKVLKLIFDPLMALDENLKPQNVLAKNVTIDSTGTSIDVEIRNDIKFHDGTVLTADDVIYSLDTIKHADIDTMYKNVLSNVGTYKKIDDYNVRLYLRRVYSNSTYALCFPVISKAYYSNAAADTVTNAMGTGMYKIDSISQMQEMILVKNESYFGAKPNIEKIRVMLTPDNKTAQTAFRQKQIDILFTEDMIAGQYNGNENVTMEKYTTMFHDFLGFNFQNETLSNVELRRVIAHAINKKDIAEKAYFGYAEESQTMIHPDSFLSTTASLYEYDLGLAKSLLKKANLEEGLIFRLLVNKENEERLETAKIIKENLAEIGITINIEEVPYEEYTARIAAKDFDLLLGGWHLLKDQDISFAFHSDYIYGGKNYISYNNPLMDTALVDAYTKTNELDAKTSFESMQELLTSELPYISLIFRENVGYINNEKLGGDLKPLEDNIYNGIENIYVKKVK